MKSGCFRNCVVILLFWLVVNPTGGAFADQAKSTAANELLALEREIESATTRADLAFLGRVYADDFRFTHGSGSVTTKSESLDLLRSGGTPFIARDLDSLDAETHGDIGITSGRIHVRTGTTSAPGREYTVWYVRVYTRHNGAWQLLSHRTVREEDGPLK